MTWHNPEAFFLLIPLFGAFAYFCFFSKKSKGTFFYSGLSLVSKKDFSLRPHLVLVPKILQLLALTAFVIALARPRHAENVASQTQEGLDIMIVMDISSSMLVQDMGNSTRLEASKQVVRDFIEGRPNDRVGLIVFSGEAFTKAPLTFDHDLLKKRLAQVKPLSVIKEGTAIGVALANATARLQHSPEKSRLVIFLTDGENNTGFIDPETALRLTRQNKIKVYSIGIGSAEGTFPVFYPVRGKMRKILITSKINKKLMKKISNQTGGEFFMAKNLTSLKQIFKKIDKLETYKMEINKWTRWTEYFERPLLAGAVLYFFSLLLSLTVFFRGI